MMGPAPKRRKLHSRSDGLGGGSKRADAQSRVGGARAQEEATLAEESPPIESSSEDETAPIASRASYAALLQSLQPRVATSARERNKKKSYRKERSRDFELPAEQLDAPDVDVSGSEEEQELDSDVEVVHANGGGASSGLFNEDPVDQEQSDPFEVRFANPDESELSKRLKAVSSGQWSAQQVPAGSVGRIKVLKPEGSSLDAATLQRRLKSVDDIKLKQKLIGPAEEALPVISDPLDYLSGPIFQYADVLFAARTVQNAASLRKVASLHALNHIFKTRDRVLKNSSRLARDPSDTDLELRDQGFTRPKVLVLLETRQSCVKYMDTITALCASEQQENKKRFQDAFANNESELLQDKPADFRELFEGNDDNEFRLGVKFTRKTIKYYSQFYQSDLIFASPLGLRRAIKADDPKNTDYDFLSSIEIVIVDQADAMLMQNWDHVEFVFDHLNLQPRESHGCDFSRVRQWYLDQSARFLRQTIVFSAYLTPDLNRLFSNHMQNVAGKVKFMQDYTGTMLQVEMQLKQTFSRFDSPSPVSEPDDRFKYFTTAVVPSLTRQPPPAEGGLGVLIFIPSYLDFVRLRNYFMTSKDVENLTCGALSEYTDISDLRRARSHFLTGKYSVLLYSGRAHHFRRYQIRGVRKVIMYGLPENPLFYPEIVGGFLGASIGQGKLDPAEATVRAMFSRWDGLSLERIVGTKRAGRMLRDAGGDTFEFR